MLTHRLGALVATLSLFVQPASAAEPTQKEAEPLVRMVLQRALQSYDYLPDRPLLPVVPPFLLREEVGGTDLKLTAAMLGAAADKFTLRTAKKLQEQADTSGKEVYYVTIAGVDVTSDKATLYVGVGLQIPRSAGTGKLCCCVARDHFAKVKGEWRYAGRERTICS